MVREAWPTSANPKLTPMYPNHASQWGVCNEAHPHVGPYEEERVGHQEPIIRKMDPSFTMVVAGTEGSSRSLIWAKTPTRCTACHCLLLLSHLQGCQRPSAHLIMLSLGSDTGVCASMNIAC